MPYGGSVFSLMKKRRVIDPSRMGFGLPQGTGWALGRNPELSGISQSSASGPTMQEFLATRPTMSNLSGEPVATSQVAGKPIGGHHQGFPDMTKGGGNQGLNSEAMLEALSELQFGQETFSSLGKAGGRGGGPYKVAQHDIIQDVTPSQGVFDPERKKRSWNLMMRGMV